MVRITCNELLNLPLGTKIRVIWHNSKYHSRNEEHFGVIFGTNIGYEDGLIDSVYCIAESIYNDSCMVYLMNE